MALLMRLNPLPLGLALAAAPLAGCASWFFSGEPRIDRSRPVALLETTGGVEYAATTELGILSLGRTAKEGPCRVHYFLGDAPMTEDGSLVDTGTAFCVATVDLRTQSVRLNDMPLTAGDDLIALYTPDGASVVESPVRLAAGPHIAGDLLEDTSVPLPAGAAVFRVADSGLLFCGLIAARATVQGEGAGRSYYVLAGLDRIRELLARPARALPEQPVYRPDGLVATRPGR
ncbi:MAG: hypothetical protein Fur0037_20670 [Planctomycetota bacterium]